MSIRDRIQKAASIVLSSVGQTFTQPHFWTYSDLDAVVAKSGVTLSNQSALGITAYYSGVTQIAQTVAQLPLILYTRDGRAKSRAFDHQLYGILHDEPNEWMTSFTLRETLQGHLLTWGNAFAEIDWDFSGREPVVQGLFPLRPDRIQLEWENKRLVYVYTVDGERVKLSPMQVLHIPGFSFDGLIGYDPITLFKESLGLSKATEEFGARFFANGSALNGVLQHPGPQRLSKEATELMRTSWEGMHKGLSNSHRVAILQEGVTYQQVGIPPENAQFMELRNFQVLDVARMLHMPPHKLAHLADATFSNIEHQNIEYVVDTIQPHLVRWEQEIRRKLLPPTEKRKYFAEFLVAGLLRGDTISRYQAYNIGRNGGWLSANDVRELENMNPVEGGDLYMVPLNMMDASQLTQIQEPQEPVKALALKASDPRRRGAVARASLIDRHRPMFVEAARKLATYEIRNVRKGMTHLTTKDALTFEAWLDEFYSESFKAYVIKHMTPVMRTLAEAVFPLASSEVSNTNPMDEAKLKAYIDGFADRYMAVHKGQMTEALKDADPVKAVTSALDTWAEVAADKIAAAETVGLSNTVAKLAFLGAGIRTLRWIAIGADNCPACADLDGQTVTTLAPPLHEGCVCQLGPG
jgi:HK97 family phage portal protein